MNNLLVKCFPAKFEKNRTVVPSDLGFLIKGVLELTLVRPRSFLHSYALLFLALFKEYNIGMSLLLNLVLYKSSKEVCFFHSLLFHFVT